MVVGVWAGVTPWEDSKGVHIDAAVPVMGHNAVAGQVVAHNAVVALGVGRMDAMAVAREVEDTADQETLGVSATAQEKRYIFVPARFSKTMYPTWACPGRAGEMLSR